MVSLVVQHSIIIINEILYCSSRFNQIIWFETNTNIWFIWILILSSSLISISCISNTISCCLRHLRPPSTTTIRVWLMCRWKFSLYEADWWEWEARHLSGELWEAKPLVSGESPFRLPMIFSQTEVARDTSNLMYDGCNRWIWKVIPYTATGHPNYVVDLLSLTIVSFPC